MSEPRMQDETLLLQAVAGKVFAPAEIAPLVRPVESNLSFHRHPQARVLDMPKTQAKRRWVWVKPLKPEEKTAIAEICDRFIAQTLKPRFLPEIRPTQFNYPVDIFGKWRGSKYSFITRYRSGFPDNAGEEFDSAFTRLDHVEECAAETRFDAMWHRHNGQWWRLHASVTLEEALHLIETDGLLQPR